MTEQKLLLELLQETCSFIEYSTVDKFFEFKYTVVNAERIFNVLKKHSVLEDVVSVHLNNSRFKDDMSWYICFSKMPSLKFSIEQELEEWVNYHKLKLNNE